MKTKCINCGKDKKTTAYRLSIGKDKYCNNLCKYEYVKRQPGKLRKYQCENCGADIFRTPSLVKSSNLFCSIQCKGEGMSKGMTKPMRLGTGKIHLRPYQEAQSRKKYYKYRAIDNKKGHNTTNYTINEYISMIKDNVCYYCGGNDNLGLDRIDNKKGHTKENVLVCCARCNMTRGDRFTVKQMQEIGKIIKSFNL